MKLLILIGLCLLSSCVGHYEAKEYKVINTYEDHFGGGRSRWFTTVEDLSGVRRSICGKLGEPGDMVKW